MQVTELLAGSLDALLWGRQAASVSLTASQRLRIAAGVARGVPGASRKAAAALTRRQARLVHGLGSRYFFVHSPA